MRLVDAAKAAGVARFLYVSYSHGIDVGCPLATAKRAVEDHLKRSGMTYTILAPSVFMEIWLSPALGFDAANAHARIYGSGTNAISWISVGDVAQFVVLALDHPAARNAILELGGPAAISPLEVVRAFEQTGGRPFTVEHVAEETPRAQRAPADVRREAPDDLLDVFLVVEDVPDALQPRPGHATGGDETPHPLAIHL